MIRLFTGVAWLIVCAIFTYYLATNWHDQVVSPSWCLSIISYFVLDGLFLLIKGIIDIKES